MLDTLKDPRDISSLFIILEILFGCIGGIIYINRPEIPKYELNDSILNFYLTLNGIFLSVTIFLGIVSSIFLKKINRLFVSILLSFVMGLGFLILHALVLSIHLFAFLSLFGFVLGFNYYLLNDRDPKVVV